MYDVVQFCSKFAFFVTLQKKLSSGGHKVSLTENRTVGVIPTSWLWGEGAENSTYYAIGLDILNVYGLRRLGLTLYDKLAVRVDGTI